MVKCSKCGRENDDSFTFCLDCGTELRSQEGQPATPAAPATGASPAAPATGAAPAAPATGASQAAPATGATPAAPKTGATPAAPKTGATPAAPRTGATPAAPRTGATPAAPRTGATPAAPATGATPAAPKTGATPAAPATGATPAAPKTGATPAASAAKTAPAGGSVECPKCGAQVAADSAFCSSCGHRMGEETAGGRTMFMHQAAPDAEQKPRARLVLIKPDGSEGTVFTLAAAKTVIGRSQGIIMFPKDPYVSPKHAEISFAEGALGITDLGSLNGVYFRMSGEEQIVPGTYFRIGRQLLRLEVPGDFQAMDADTPEGDDSKFWGSPPPQVWARLVQVLEGGKIGEIHLLTQPEVLLGREEGEVRFPEDGFISSRHCMLVNKQGDCFLKDLGSSNGTYMRLREPKKLSHEDRVQIGNQVLKVDLS